MPKKVNPKGNVTVVILQSSQLDVETLVEGESQEYVVVDWVYVCAKTETLLPKENKNSATTESSFLNIL